MLALPSRHVARAARRLSSVPSRLAALRRLQAEAEALSAQSERQITIHTLALRAALHEKARLLHARRAQIVAGEELSEEEKALAPYDGPMPSSLSDSLSGYWREVIKRATELSEYCEVSDADEAVLSHLRDIQLRIEVDPEDPSRDKLTFTFLFASNEFLQPESETLTITFARRLGEVESTEGCEIKWKEGMQRVPGNSQDGPSFPSFFDFFAPSQLAAKEGMEDSSQEPRSDSMVRAQR